MRTSQASSSFSRNSRTRAACGLLICGGSASRPDQNGTVKQLIVMHIKNREKYTRARAHTLVTGARASERTKGRRHHRVGPFRETREVVSGANLLLHIVERHIVCLAILRFTLTREIARAGRLRGIAHPRDSHNFSGRFVATSSQCCCCCRRGRDFVTTVN